MRNSINIFKSSNMLEVESIVHLFSSGSTMEIEVLVIITLPLAVRDTPQ